MADCLSPQANLNRVDWRLLIKDRIPKIARVFCCCIFYNQNRGCRSKGFLHCLCYRLHCLGDSGLMMMMSIDLCVSNN